MDHDNDQFIEVEDDADSTLGSQIGSETSSLNSLVLQFEFENGRRYHSYQSGHELDRMDLEHHIFMILLDGELHVSPLKDPQRILDLGTGTGIWAIEMADKYPSASVIGTDLSPVQPSFVPPNCEFQIDDFGHDWTFRRNSFDLIHSRLLLASVADYPRLFRQGLDALKPGGYMEMHDIDAGFHSDDNTIPADSRALQWSTLFLEGCKKIGHAIPSPEEYKTLMEDAGFVDVRLRIQKRPSNVWPKDTHMKRLGLYTLTNHLNGLHAFTIGLFTRVLGWSSAEVEILIAKCREEWKDSSIHAYQKVVFVSGRKPVN
ncbi:S-adenosyl-L-methionine-dependent methyltransferase [Aspergillus californicus]